MSNWLDPYWIFKPKPFFRFSVFVMKWFMRLTSASIELYLHGNFGRRYFRRLFLSAFLCTCCAGLSRNISFFTVLFIIGLYAFSFYRTWEIFARRMLGLPEPHTLSEGDSWGFWQHVPVSESAVQYYLEPALCALVSLPLVKVDPFLHGWLLASAISLFVKQQIEAFKIRRRVLASIDAKHEAQALQAANKAFQQQTKRIGQKPNRARLP